MQPIAALGSLYNVVSAGGGGGGAPIVLSIAPSPGAGDRFGSGTCTTNQVEVCTVVSGGTAPFSIAWTDLTFGMALATNPGSFYTNISLYVGNGKTKVATIQATVTDALGATGTATVVCTFTSFQSGGFA